MRQVKYQKSADSVPPPHRTEGTDKLLTVHSIYKRQLNQCVLYGLDGLTTKCFLHWFQNILLKYAISLRPLLPIINGHKSHYFYDSINISTYFFKAR